MIGVQVPKDPENGEEMFLLQTLQLAIAKVEHALLEAVLDKTKGAADHGLDDVVVHEINNKTSSLYATTCSRHIRLGFSGRVSPVPTVGSLEVGEFLNIKLYVQSRIVKSGLAGSFFEPAWLVRTVMQNMDGFDMETPNMKAGVKKLPIEMKVSKAFLGPYETIKFNAKLHYLTCEDATLGKENVELIRPKIPDEQQSVTHEWMKTYNETLKAAKTRVAAKTKAGSDSNTVHVDPEWKFECKHLFS